MEDMFMRGESVVVAGEVPGGVEFFSFLNEGLGLSFSFRTASLEKAMIVDCMKKAFMHPKVTLPEELLFKGSV